MKKKLGGFEMKPIFRLLVAMSIIAFATGIMAVSCGKTAGNNNNNNSGGNNSGGGGNGGGDITLNGDKIKITPVTDVTVANKTITIKASVFHNDAINERTTTDFAGSSGSLLANKVFDIEYDGATGGMVLVAHGDITKPEDITVSTTTVSQSFSPNKFDGIEITTRTSDGARMLTGMNVVSIFMDTNAPANTDADKAPFAFSIAADIQPFFFCVATAPAITEDITGNAAAIAGIAAKTLAGAQKATCYVSSKLTPAAPLTPAINGFGNGTMATAWFTATGNVKKSIKVAISAVKTDAKTVANIGLPGADDAAKLQALKDGINKAEMAAIVKANADGGVAAFDTYTITLAQ